MKSLKLKQIACLVLTVTMVISIIPVTNVFAETDNRTKIMEIEATSTDYELTYGQKFDEATFIVTKGEPATFGSNGSRSWLIWNDSEEKWTPYRGSYIKEGRYKGQYQARIDGESGKEYVIGEGCTVQVDGENWGIINSPFIRDNYSFGWIKGPEVVVEKTDNLPLAVMKTVEIPNSDMGIPIDKVDLSESVLGGKGAITFAKKSGPEWLEVSSNGIISGTPQKTNANAGTQDALIVTATDSNGESIDVEIEVDYVRPSNEDKIKIKEIEATVTGYEAVYGEKVSAPEFTVTKGQPAYFDISGGGKWKKWDETTDQWKNYYEKTFTEGKFFYKPQIRIDGDGAAGYVLEDGCTVKVGNENWGQIESVKAFENYSCGYIKGPVITVVNTCKHSNLVKVESREPTYTEDGWKEYYQCECGAFFEDAEGTVEIPDLDAWKQGKGKLDKRDPSGLIVTELDAGLCRVSGGYDDVVLNWSSVEDADGYNLYYRRPSKTSSWTFLGTTESTTYTKKDLYDGWKYEFVVVPYTVINGEEIWGEEAMTSIVTGRNAKVPETMSARLSTASGGYDDIYVSWSKSSNADGYFLYYRRPSKSSSWSYIGRTTKTSYLKKNLSDGYKYEFKIVPYDYADGCRYKSTSYKTAYAYTLKKISTPSVTRYNSSRVKVKWNNISGESGYQISRSTSKTGTNIVYTYGTTKGTYKTLTATRNRTYYYKVRAYRNVTKNGKTYKVYGPWSSVRSYRLK